METKDKPTIHYDIDGVVHIVIGVGATVNVLDHPGFNYGQMVWTSEVLNYDENTGIFETKNTIYEPMTINK